MICALTAFDASVLALQSRLAGSEPAPDTDRVVAHACAISGVSVRHLQEGVRSSQVAKTRMVLCYFLREHLGMSLESIAEIVGLGDHRSVSYNVNQFSIRRREQPFLEHWLSELAPRQPGSSLPTTSAYVTTER